MNCDMCCKELNEWEIAHEYCQHCEDHCCPDSDDYDGDPIDDGQPDHYTEMQDFMGGDDWDHGQYDCDF